MIASIGWRPGSTNLRRGKLLSKGVWSRNSTTYPIPSARFWLPAALEPGRSPAKRRLPNSQSKVESLGQVHDPVASFGLLASSSSVGHCGAGMLFQASLIFVPAVLSFGLSGPLCRLAPPLPKLSCARRGENISCFWHFCSCVAISSLDFFGTQWIFVVFGASQGLVSVLACVQWAFDVLLFLNSEGKELELSV